MSSKARGQRRRLERMRRRGVQLDLDSSREQLVAAARALGCSCEPEVRFLGRPELGRVHEVQVLHDDECPLGQAGSAELEVPLTAFSEDRFKVRFNAVRLAWEIGSGRMAGDREAEKVAMALLLNPPDGASRADPALFMALGRLPLDDAIGAMYHLVEIGALTAEGLDTTKLEED